MTTLTKRAPDLVLCIFIHGFKGDDNTFGGFPQRLQHVLEQTLTNVQTECVVFPAYETKGDLNQAVHRFVDWLTTLVVEKEVAKGLGGGAGKAKIVICSHSMGGLLAADATLAIVSSRADKAAPLWPNIIACIAFDTPYLGLHPWIFKNSVSKAVEYAQTFKNIATGLGILGASTSGPQQTQGQPGMGSSGKSSNPPLLLHDVGSSAQEVNKRPWSRLLTPAVGYAAGGVLLASAAAGTAYYHREDITASVTWAQDHLKYVGNLWEEQKLRDRLLSLVQLSKPKEEGGQDIFFRDFYTFLPPRQDFPQPRTFVVLPKSKATPSKYDPSNYFSAARNSIAADEVSAHVGMFAATTNDGYYELGLEVVAIIRNSFGEIPLSIEEAEDVVKNEELMDGKVEGQDAEDAEAGPPPTAPNS